MPQCLFSSDNNSQKIYRHSGFLARILSSFSSPSTDPRGIDVHNGTLYTVDNNSLKIYRHSGFSSTIAYSFSSPSTDPTSVVFDDTSLYSSDATSLKIYQHSSYTDTIRSSFSSPSDSPLGLAFDDMYLYSTDTDSDKIYRHSKFSSTIEFSFAGADESDITCTDIDIYVTNDSNRIYQHSGFSTEVLSSFSSPSTSASGIAVGWFPSVNIGNVALTDGGFNEAEFSVDSYSEVDVNYDQHKRTKTGDLKHYELTDKKKFILGIKNISRADKNSLKTLYDLRRKLYFYRDATDREYTAQVIWKGNFDFHTPTKKSGQFIDSIYAGNIVLEEI